LKNKIEVDIMNIPSIPLRALLQAQEQYSTANSLPEVLGDGYLYKHSPIFARVRDVAVDRGYRFVESESHLWHDYQAMPLLSLKAILSEKSVPYFDNVSVLRKLYQQKPHIELPIRLVYEVVKRNFLFHETCHCVAFSVIETQSRILDQFSSDNERFVVSAFLQEAFANSMERMSSVIAPSKTYAFFMNMNNYMNYEPGKQQFWECALDKLGLERLFILTFLTYLELNLQGRGKTFAKDNILNIAGVSSQDSDVAPVVDQLLDKELHLSEVFREETTRGYFRLYGCEAELCSIRDANLLSNTGITDDLLALLEHLGSIIGTHELAAA
jgi:hypothetical protein